MNIIYGTTLDITPTFIYKIPAGLPPELAGVITEMGQALRSGSLTKRFFVKVGDATRRIKLEQFAKEFKIKNLH